MGVKRARRTHALVPPDVAQQLVLGPDAGGVGGERAQQRVLLLRQRQRSAVEVDGARRRVQLQRSDAQPPAPRAKRGAPQQTRDARPQGFVLSARLPVYLGERFVLEGSSVGSPQVFEVFTSMPECLSLIRVGASLVGVFSEPRPDAVRVPPCHTQSAVWSRNGGALRDADS